MEYMTTKETELQVLRSQITLVAGQVHELGTEAYRLALVDARDALLDAAAALRKAKLAVTFAELNRECVIYDNGGETLDRYTVFHPELTAEGVVLGMSHNGVAFSQMCNLCEPGEHLGELIAFADLSHDAQYHIAYRLERI